MMRKRSAQAIPIRDQNAAMRMHWPVMIMTAMLIAMCVFSSPAQADMLMSILAHNNPGMGKLLAFTLVCALAMASLFAAGWCWRALRGLTDHSSDKPL